ncbi:MAG: pyridoxine 5'-phosphate synthase [bacterium]
MSRLFVNIDHVATIRNQRGTVYPDPIEAAHICEMNGAEGITVHLREDRRHIKDHDVEKLRESLNSILNLEMAATDEMIRIAKKIKPEITCIVPEKREELTTEGGLNVNKYFDKIKALVDELQGNGIEVSLFIEPDLDHIDIAKKTGAVAVEIHTGSYANSSIGEKRDNELSKIMLSIKHANSLGLKCNAGHGLDYFNVRPLVGQHNGISEFNIGHSIISRAVLDGLAKATKDMTDIIRGLA